MQNDACISEITIGANCQMSFGSLENEYLRADDLDLCKEIVQEL